MLCVVIALLTQLRSCEGQIERRAQFQHFSPLKFKLRREVRECFGCLTLSEARLGLLPVFGFPPPIPGSTSLLGQSSASRQSSSAQLSNTSFRLKDVSCLLPGWRTDTACRGKEEEEDATTITRQRTTDQATDRDRLGQTEEFLGRR